MNAAQRIVGVLVVLVFLIASIYPPKMKIRLTPGDNEVVREWEFLFDDDYKKHGRTYFSRSEIDWTTLVYEWCVIFVAGTGLIWFSRRPVAPARDDTVAVP